MKISLFLIFACVMLCFFALGQEIVKNPSPVSSGTITISSLAALTFSTNQADRLLAAKTLWRKIEPRSECVVLLSKLATDTDTHVAMAALSSLEKMGPNPSLAKLLDLSLSDPRKEVRIVAIKAILFLSDNPKTYADRLLEVATSEKADEGERKAAIRTLGRIKADGKAFDFLVANIDNKDHDIQIAVLEGLNCYYNLPNSLCKKLLEKFRKNPPEKDQNLKPLIMTILMHSPSFYPEVKGDVFKGFESENVDVRRMSAAFVRRMLEENPSAFETNSVSVLISSLNDSDSGVRRQLIESLARCPKMEIIGDALKRVSQTDKIPANRRVADLAYKQRYETK